MADEEIQILEGCVTHPAANHGARIRRRNLSFPHPAMLTLFKVDFPDPEV